MLPLPTHPSVQRSHGWLCGCREGQGDGPDEVGAADAELLARGQGRRHDARAGMPTSRPGVVGFVGVGKRSVDQRGLEWPAHNGVGNDGGDLLAAVGAGEQGRGAARWQLRSRHHGGDRVEDVPLRLLERLRRQRPIARLTHVRAEPGHDVANRLIGSGRRFERRLLRGGGIHRCRQSRGRHNQAGALQNVAARQVANFWQWLCVGLLFVMRHGCKMPFCHEDTKNTKSSRSFNILRGLRAVVTM